MPKKSLLRRIGSALAERPTFTASGVGVDETPAPGAETMQAQLGIPTPMRLKSITSTSRGAPNWVSGVGDFLTALGAGPEAAQRQQLLRQRNLESLAQQTIAPQMAAAQAQMEQRKIKAM